MPVKKYVLSVSGGGVRDVVPAMMMNELQNLTGTSVGHLFDMLVGVSGGAMLTLYANLHRDHCVDFVELFHLRNMARIMDKSPVDRIMGEVQLSTVYDGLGKERVLQQYLGPQTRMSDLSALPTVIPVFNLQQRHIELVCTHQPGYAAWPAWTVAHASSAAIPYFPPAELPNGQLYVDGGFASNDPVLLAYIEARRHFGVDCNVAILSLGSGRQQADTVEYATEQVQAWGGIQWMAHGLLDLMMDAPNELMSQEVQRLIQLENASSQPNHENQLLVINPLMPRIKLDDYSQLERLKDIGHEALVAARPELVHFFQQTQ